MFPAASGTCTTISVNFPATIAYPTAFTCSTRSNSYINLESGQTTHNGKYVRIVRLLTAYPEKQFVLFGDDTQQDPYIYYKLSKDFPGRIFCIYLRHVRKSRL